MISVIGNGFRIILVLFYRIANEGEYQIAIRALNIAEYSAPDEDFNFHFFPFVAGQYTFMKSDDM